MTVHQLADSVSRLADSIRDLPDGEINGYPLANLQGDHAAGAAILYLFARSVLTMTEREDYKREELLVLLDSAIADRDIMPVSIRKAIESFEEMERS